MTVLAHAGWEDYKVLSFYHQRSGQSGVDHLMLESLFFCINPTAECALFGGLTLFDSIIGKQAG